MEIMYRNASIEDIDFLVESRLEFINISQADDNYEIIRGNLYSYFEKALFENRCNIILAEVNSSIIGTGIIFYYDSVPSRYNPWGKNAYITSMFVDEKYRRRGIAAAILDKLMKASLVNGYHIIMLQASEMGKPLYEKYGFQEGNNGMILKL